MADHDYNYRFYPGATVRYLFQEEENKSQLLTYLLEQYYGITKKCKNGHTAVNNKNRCQQPKCRYSIFRR